MEEHMARGDPGRAGCGDVYRELVSMCVLLACVHLAPVATHAHDFWIQPATFRPGVPSPLALGLRVGDDFPRGQGYRRNPQHIVRFVIVGPGGSQPVLGVDGRDPAGLVRITEPGIYVVGYESTATVLELAADRFEAYLREEGLEHVLRHRVERGETNRPGREAFARCAKTLVLAGTAAPAGYDRALGFILELIPEQNPYGLQAGEELAVRLLYRGAPLGGGRVVARHAADSAATVEARTDPQGQARLRLGRPGVWLLRSLHMVPAPQAARAEWESFWASLTFALP
jgi:uncharacterized GH25 family protein